jgi:hypothetical protein
MCEIVSPSSWHEEQTAAVGEIFTSLLGSVSIAFTPFTMLRVSIEEARAPAASADLKSAAAAGSDVAQKAIADVAWEGRQRARVEYRVVESDDHEWSSAEPGHGRVNSVDHALKVHRLFRISVAADAHHGIRGEPERNVCVVGIVAHYAKPNLFCAAVSVQGELRSYPASVRPVTVEALVHIHDLPARDHRCSGDAEIFKDCPNRHAHREGTRSIGPAARPSSITRPLPVAVAAIGLVNCTV